MTSRSPAELERALVGAVRSARRFGEEEKWEAQVAMSAEVQWLISELTTHGLQVLTDRDGEVLGVDWSRATA